MPAEPVIPRHVEIPVELVNKVLTYLGTRPLQEVLDLFIEVKATADRSFAERAGLPQLPKVAGQKEG